MDTSIQYVRMCESADEITGNHLWEIGDWLYGSKGIVVITSKPRSDIKGDRTIWLPRQDQLQDIISKYWD